MPDLLCPACQSPLAHEAAFCSRCGAQSPTVISIASPVSPFAPPPTPVSSPGPGPAPTNPPQEASIMERLGMAGRRFAETFTWDRAATDTLSHLDQVIAT